MNFLNLKTRLAIRRGAVSGTLQSDTNTRYGHAVNEVHRQLLRMTGMESLRHGVITFASVASTPQYALPVQGIARVNRIFETTNDRKLEYKTLGWLREHLPDPQTTTPWAWCPVGYEDVHTQPSDASEIFVKSTSGSDTTQTCYIEGYITGGYYRTASVTLTGTTAVTLSASITNFIRITKCYLSAVGVGIVTLHEDSGAGTELSRLAIGDVRAQFSSLLLIGTPSAAITYTCDVLRSIPDMTNDTDEPLIPEDFHDLILDKAERKELRKADDPNRIRVLDADILKGERELKSYVINHPDYRPRWDDAMPPQVSTLGPYYPAGI